MEQTTLIYYKKIYRFLILVVIGSLFFIQSEAQRRTESQHSNQQRNNFPGRNKEQRVQPQPPRQQNPRVDNQQPTRPIRQEQTVRPRQVAPTWAENNNIPRPRHNPVPPRVNNNVPPPTRPNPVPQRADNNNNNNNRFRPVQAANRPNHYWPQRYYSSSNPGWRYSSLPRRNTIVTSFSFPYRTIYYGGYNYRYCDGIFYRPYNNYFQVIAPPFGLFIDILPFGYRRIYVNDYPYYYYNGIYYDNYENSYRVVAPPVGAIVESIPEGYETIVIDGETYYKVDNVQYKPVVQENGEIWYQVLKIG